MSTSVTCQHPVRLPPKLAYSARQIQLAAQMCHAMSDPARLQLLLRLADTELCVSELVAQEGAKLGSVSARLKTLYTAGLVTRRRAAKHIYYRLADDHVHQLLHNVLSHAAEAA